MAVARFGAILSSIAARPPSTLVFCALMVADTASKAVSEINFRRESSAGFGADEVCLRKRYFMAPCRQFSMQS